VLSLADTPQLSAAVQATIFVMEAGTVQVKAARQSLERLQRSGGHLLGGIVSKYDARTASGNYGYVDGYSYGS
jgi:hypothetical protein